VYYSQRGTRLLLLAGGDKSSQRSDIALAMRLAQTYGD
jgi:putative component of toxin-antitoxin plasmid stabilization module